MLTMVVFIDESGALGDKNDRFVVFAGVLSKKPQNLVRLIPKARKRIPTKKKRKRERLVSEFKFRSVGDNTKERILGEIANQEVGLFVIVLDKEGRNVNDTPQNYALLVALVVKSALKRIELDGILIDRHYNQVYKQRELTSELVRLCGKEISVKHVDSLTDSRVDLADFVAGAILKSVRDKEDRFKNLIRSKILSLKIVKWRELKSGRF